ncbi:uncharacterized protein LOC130654387 [Hydractinia symbiolongicarpus]|uniref:uncharacterized protein LOC130654387 n=1 Tax=Hydractinia symbiolongicarpus TaxID=13093 RepID=UPI00254DF493|nr:uncharacterized protein LOC130654387 [Hydractinia symbiolongicarpus]
MKRNQKFIVDTNDQYEAKITTTTGEAVLYENLKEYDGEIVAVAEEPDANMLQLDFSDDTTVEVSTEEKSCLPALKSLDILFEPALKRSSSLSPKDLPTLQEETFQPEIHETTECLEEGESISSLLKKLFREIKEIKVDIREIRERIDINEATTNQINDKVELVETTTKHIETHLKRRKEKSKLSSETFFVRPDSTRAFQVTPTVNATNITSEEFNMTPEVTSILADITNVTPEHVNVAPEEMQPPQISYMHLLENPMTTDPTTFQLFTEMNDPVNSTPLPKKRKINSCACYIKQQLQALYTEEELAVGRIQGGVRNYQTGALNTSSLSPNRMSVIVRQAKKRYSDEFMEMKNLNEDVNSKCRQVKRKLIAKQKARDNV